MLEKNCPHVLLSSIFQLLLSLFPTKERLLLAERVNNIRPVYISDPCRGHRRYVREKVFGHSKKKLLLVEDEGEREVWRKGEIVMDYKWV